MYHDLSCIQQYRKRVHWLGLPSFSSNTSIYRTFFCCRIVPYVYHSSIRRHVVITSVNTLWLILDRSSRGDDGFYSCHEQASDSRMHMIMFWLGSCLICLNVFSSEVSIQLSRFLFWWNRENDDKSPHLLVFFLLLSCTWRQTANAHSSSTVAREPIHGLCQGTKCLIPHLKPVTSMED